LLLDDNDPNALQKANEVNELYIKTI